MKYFQELRSHECGRERVTAEHTSTGNPIVEVQR
jgi:hypothetical protein